MDDSKNKNQKKRWSRADKRTKRQQQQSQTALSVASPSQPALQPENGDNHHAEPPKQQHQQHSGKPGKKKLRRLKRLQALQQLSPMDICIMSAERSIFTESVVLISPPALQEKQAVEDKKDKEASSTHTQQQPPQQPAEEQQERLVISAQVGDQARGRRILKLVTMGTLPSTSLLRDDSPLQISVQPLLVLDLNGILCHRIRREREPPGAVYRNVVLSIANTAVVPRTDLHDFLTFLDRHFCLAVWTSARSKTAKELVKALIPQTVRNRLLFVWAQHDCDVRKDLTPTTRADGSTKEEFEKNLSKVWDKFPLWNVHNTLLMDDSPEKCTHWLQNAIHPPALNGQQLMRNNAGNALQPDEENESYQRLFFERLVHFWSQHSLVQTWDEESGDITTHLFAGSDHVHVKSDTSGLTQFLREHAVGHMGWKS